jgi:hypothetical protein
MNGNADDARRDVAVHVRLVDPWSGGAISRDVVLSDVEPTERGLLVGPSCFPWHRVISYEWEVQTEAPRTDERPQLHVRLVYDDAGSPREYVVAADGFEVGPWTAAAMLPDRVEPEAGRAVYRRLTVPWDRVAEYERQIVRVPATRSVSVSEPDAVRMKSTSAATGA